MKATFVLTPAEARRLIAKTVIQMPEFQKAWKEAYVLLAGGTTNAFIAQELLGDKSIEPGLCTVGNSTDGMLCVTEPSSRKSFPNVFYKGQPFRTTTLTPSSSRAPTPLTRTAMWASSPPASMAAPCPTSSAI